MRQEEERARRATEVGVCGESIRVFGGDCWWCCVWGVQMGSRAMPGISPPPWMGCVRVFVQLVLLNKYSDV